MSRLSYSSSGLSGSLSRRSLPRWLLLATITVLAGLSACALPGYAAAEALPGPEPTAGPSGLPDGRVYEQVSPQNKPGSEAGGSAGGTPPYIVAGMNGDEVAFSNTGPIGETPTGFDFFTIARRFSTGWQSHGAVSRGEGVQAIFSTNPQHGLGFSMDMTASVFGANDVFVPEQELQSPTPHIYRYGEDGVVQWIGKPTIADPVKFEGFQGSNTGELAGAASLDYSTIYFGFQGTLTPADEEPNPALGNVSRAQEIRAENEGGSPPASNDGFFVWREGVLESAGVLPDGHLDPFGAVPAATRNGSQMSGESLRNQVSDDGRTAFFLSPDPESASGRASELYARRTSEGGVHTTALVSRDELLPEEGGLPAAALHGGTFVYASPDGSRVFFESKDQLTASAPNDEEAKTYEFDTGTETLTYLFSLGSVTILRASRDGSNFLFVHGNELELWNEGVLTDIAPVDEGFLNTSNGKMVIRATPTGSVYLFGGRTSFAKFGFKNGSGKYNEVYRYETAANRLSCVSCPSGSIPASGNAELSHAFPSGGIGNTFIIITGNNGISEDASRIFFDTPDGLVPQDSNGMRDAYEWQGGSVRLISTGVAKEESFAGDTSPTGNDLFFSTSEGLVPGDNDEVYDVYDARVPRPGDQLPPSAVPCEGAVCQGPPSVPQLFSPPGSETFNGAGDLTPPPANHSAPKSLTRKQKLARALKACRRHRDARKRVRCERQARRRYGAKAARVRAHQGNGNRQGNGRGN